MFCRILWYNIKNGFYRLDLTKKALYEYMGLLFNFIYMELKYRLAKGVRKLVEGKILGGEFYFGLDGKQKGVLKDALHLFESEAYDFIRAEMKGGETSTVVEEGNPIGLSITQTVDLEKEEFEGLKKIGFIKLTKEGKDRYHVLKGKYGQ